MKLINLIEHAQNEAVEWMHRGEPVAGAYEAGEAAYRELVPLWDKVDEVMYAAAFEAVVDWYLHEEESYWRWVYAREPRENPHATPEEPETDWLALADRAHFELKAERDR